MAGRTITLHERLATLYPDASGRSVKQWLLAGRVHLNGRVVRRGDTPVSAGDRIELRAREIPFPAVLRLVHEDEDIVVVDKPPGLLTIATEGERERTAYRILNDWASAHGGRIFVVHRLDRDTSGLLVFARSIRAKRALQAQFAARTAERTYVARVEGAVAAEEGTLASRLVVDRTLRVRSVSRERRSGEEAITRYRVRERSRDATLLELSLITGRRGQIRAQLAALGHPIVGDHAHGSRRDPFRRLCLHATRLAFVHPRGGRVSFASEAPHAWRRP